MECVISSLNVAEHGLDSEDGSINLSEEDLRSCEGRERRTARVSKDEPDSSPSFDVQFAFPV